MPYFAQEMVVRLGCATGMGHAAMIFRRFGSFWGWFSLGDLMIVNFATIVTEFIGISAGLGFFGVPPWISVLLTIAFLFAMVSTGAYKRWENCALALVPLNFLVLPAVLALKPNYAEAASHYFRVTLPGGLNPDLVHRAGYAYGALYAIALINAGLIGGVANSLANAWALGEVADVPSSLNRTFREAPLFYVTYAFCLLAAGAIVLIPHAPLELITTSVRALAAIILPVTIVFLNLLLNDRALLGPLLVNKPWQNAANWSMIVLLFGLSAILAAQTIAPNLFPKMGA